MITLYPIQLVLLTMIVGCLFLTIGMFIGRMIYKDPVLEEQNNAEDTFTNKMLQQSEDIKYEYNVIKEANRAFNEYLDSPEYIIDGKKCKGAIILFNPCGTYYTVYHEASAKYINADFNKLCREKYLELKEKYEKDNGSNISSGSSQG